MATRTSWPSKLALEVGPRDHIQGPPNAPVTLVEYGDYECPYCGMAHPVIKELQKRMGDSMRFVFRNFPLTNVHFNAEPAAEAAEAAGAQGKFWEMHDTLYENQDALDYDDLLAYAEQLDLDVSRFEDELARHAYLDRIREDFMSGVHSGVQGTPTFFINGVRYEGSYDVDSLLQALQSRARGAAA